MEEKKISLSLNSEERDALMCLLGIQNEISNSEFNGLINSNANIYIQLLERLKKENASFSKLDLFYILRCYNTYQALKNIIDRYNSSEFHTVYSKANNALHRLLVSECLSDN